jgi:hypothetical protein
MRRLLTALILLGLTAPAIAAEKPAADDNAAKPGAPGTNVDMPFLMAPMNGADGKLAGYAYISPRLTASSDVVALAVRDKIAFIQDAFVRDVNGRDVAKSNDPATVDQPALEARLLADARKVMGAGKVLSIALVQVQIAPLHPMETPALNAPPPLPDSPAKPAESRKPGA